jgi:hypothetical protein
LTATFEAITTKPSIMKKLLSLTTLFLLISAFAFSQKAESTDKTKIDTELSEKIDKLTESVQKLSDKIKVDTLTSADVGEITFYKSESVPNYTYEKKEGFKKKQKTENSTKIKITKVVIEVRDGVVHDVQVFTDNGRVFSNNLAPIELNRLNERCDLLGSKFFDGQQEFYVQTCDFLNFERMGGFIPNDVRIVLTKEDNKYLFKKEVGINSIFNIRLYSDLLGSLGNKPNGLVQTDVDFRTPLLTTNMWNSNTQLLNYFNFHFNLSRFDNDFQYTTLDSTFKRIDFYQRSWLTTELGFNIISGNLSKKSNNRWAADLVGGVSLSNAVTDQDTTTVLLPYFGLNPNLSMKVARNIFVNISSKLIWQYAPKLKDNAYGSEVRIIRPEFEISWNPLSSPGNKLFGRVRYVQQFNDNNPFFQFQLGYNLSLSEIINKKIENK